MTSLDELRSKRAELEAQQKKLDTEIKKMKEDEKRLREEQVHAKIEALTPEQKTALLSLIKHDRSSCSDADPCNGYSYATDNYRCRKCMLMEILNGEHGGMFDFDITVDIERID